MNKTNFPKSKEAFNFKSKNSFKNQPTKLLEHNTNQYKDIVRKSHQHLKSNSKFKEYSSFYNHMEKSKQLNDKLSNKISLNNTAYKNFYSPVSKNEVSHGLNQTEKYMQNFQHQIEAIFKKLFEKILRLQYKLAKHQKLWNSIQLIFTQRLRSYENQRHETEYLKRITADMEKKLKAFKQQCRNQMENTSINKLRQSIVKLNNNITKAYEEQIYSQPSKSMATEISKHCLQQLQLIRYTVDQIKENTKNLDVCYQSLSRFEQCTQIIYKLIDICLNKEIQSNLSNFIKIKLQQNIEMRIKLQKIQFYENIDVKPKQNLFQSLHANQ